MKVPSGNIPLSEVFQKYFEWRWRDSRANSALKRLATAEERLNKRAPHSPAGNRQRRKQLKAQRRTDIALVEFRRAFESGRLEARAWDPKQSREVTLTPSQWKAAFYAERLFLADTVPDFFRADKALASYVDLQFYVEKRSFEEWLTKQADSAASTIEKQSQPQSPRNRAVEKKECVVWYVRRVKNWPKTQRPPTVAEEWQDAKSELSPVITRDRVRELRREYAPKEWTARGRRG